MELIFVRHGETEYNHKSQVMGKRIDAPLDESGLKQAHEVIGKLPSDFELIYSSPLHRAAQTAKIIADYFKKNIEIRNELVERDFGSLSGKTWAEIDKETGKPMKQLDDNLMYDYTPYGGETVAQVKDRLETFLEDVKAKHGNGKVVVVAHYGIISLMNSLYPPIEHHKLSNISIHTFQI